MSGRALSCLLLSLFVLAVLVQGSASRRVNRTIKLVSYESTESEDFFDKKPAVQFSDAVLPTFFEDQLERQAESGTDAQRLHALRLLVMNYCPSSVPLQWKTLCELHRNQALREELEPIEERFDRAAVLNAVLADSTARDSFHWSIRAAGVLQVTEAIPRLTELALNADLDTSLAAGRSIEEIDDPQTNEALAAIYTSWRYDAFVRAGRALLKRDRDFFAKLLVKTEPPDRFAYRHGLFLAKVDNPQAVPFLCQSVGNIQIIDGDMFSEIARLGLPVHATLIEQLPDQVRPDQLPTAKACVAAFRQRVNDGPP